MLELAISKARHISNDAQQKLSVESSIAVEQVFNDIVVLNDFINKEIYAIKNSSNFDESGKKAARRRVFEQAVRKFEVIKAKRNYSALSEESEGQLADTSIGEKESLLQFLREKEIRDRLFGMTEAQILSLFGESLWDGSNPLLTGAILNSPTGFELVSENILKKLRRANAREISPRIAEKGETVSCFNAMVGDMFTLIKTAIDGLRLKELPTPLARPKAPKDPPFRF
jgi:hypothetical protein